MPNVHVTPIVGLPQFSGWSHVIEGTHSSPHRFVAVLAVAGKQASNVGRDVASLLLSETINSSEELYGKLAAAVNLTEEAECQLAIGAALISDKKTVFAVYRAAVFLRRSTKIGTILQSGDSLKLIEGSRSEDDVFALVTEQATQFLGEIELKSKQGYDVDTIITSIVPGVHTQSDSSLSAFAFVTHEAEVEHTAVQYNQEQPGYGPVADEGAEESETMDPHASAEVEPRVALREVQPLASIAESKLQAGEKKSTAAALFAATAHVFSNAWYAIIGLLQWLWLLTQWIVRTTRRLILTIRSVQAPTSDGMPAVQYYSPVRQRRAKIILGLIIMVVLVLAASIGYILQARNRELIEAERLVTPLREELRTAESQVDAEPVIARDRVQRVIQELDSLQAEHRDTERMVKVFKAEQIAAQQMFDSISGKEALASLPVFYDLRLVKSDFVTTHITQVGTKAVFFDAERRQLISLDLAEKTPQLLTVSEQSSIRALASGGDNKVLLMNGGISALQLAPDAKLETLKAEGDSTRGGTLLGTFDRFVYVFNPVKRNLYRYAKQDDGFSDPIGWLQVSRGLDYGIVVSMTIDGDIWLGSSDGSIRKFTSGTEQEFAIQGLTQAFDSAVTLFTTGDLEHLYVLEPARHRIVVLSKSGQFLRELSNQSLGAATGMVVVESLSKAFAVSGATVFEVAL